MHKINSIKLLHKNFRPAPQPQPPPQKPSAITQTTPHVVLTPPPPKITETSEKINHLSSNTAHFMYSICICIVIPQDGAVPETMIKHLRKIQSFFHKSFVVFVTNSDSTADTYSKIPNSLHIHINSSKVADLRNAYINFILKNKSVFDLCMVIDPKIALASELPVESLKCCESSTYDEWDAAFANQSYKYYDVESLRTADFHTDISELTGDELLRKKRSLQYHIPGDEPPIQVLSAFGGLAIYKTKYITETTRYKSDGHVSFNLALKKEGARMFIQPSLILKTLEELVHLYQ